MRYSVHALLIIGLLSSSFYWGYTSHKNHTFPYSFIANDTEGRTAVNMPDTDALKTLGYAMGSPVSGKGGMAAGVTVNKAGRTSPGLNLYNSVDRDRAVLLDMSGDTVRSWSLDSGTKWQYVEQACDGGLLAIEEGIRLVRLDPESNLVWELKARAHHDLSETPDGNILVLTRKREEHKEFRESMPYDVDYVTEVTPEGALAKEISVLEILRNSDYAYLIPTSKSLQEDIFHANSIEVFDGSREHLSPMFKRGNWLLSLRNINFICIYDPYDEEILWGWGPSDLYHQHHPTLLDNGNILVFDNGLRISRVLELDPATYRVVWRYGGTRDTYFYSETRGSAQRLSNGNTLITVSDRGYVMEVTGDGEVVWKFENPDTFVEDDGTTKRASIYRLVRSEDRR